MENPEVWTERLDHLGIVAGVCREIGLIEEIDRMVGPTDRKVSVGQATQAMVLNALGFVGRALYLTPEFFANKPVELLIGEGIQAEDLNDDSLGRALDQLHAKGVPEVFAQVAGRGLGLFGIESDWLHRDSTSFSLFGDYEGGKGPAPPSPGGEGTSAAAAPEGAPPGPEEGAGAGSGGGEEGETAVPEGSAGKSAGAVIQVRHGSSKDHRPDLKQAVLNLVCTHQAAIPVWLEALSGNSQDRSTFPVTIQAYLQHWQASEETFFTVDSALYSEENIQTLSEQCRWVTRIPAPLAAVQELLAALGREQMEDWGEGYWGTEVGSIYGGVKQRWIVLFSQAAWEREQKSLAKRLQKAQEQAEKQWQALSRQEWKSPEEAQQAVAHQEKKWRYHRAQYELQAVPHFAGRGRPKADQEPAWTGWQVQGEVVEDEAAVAAEQQKQGKFILGTNELDAERLPGPTMLATYKGQGTTVERGFRFLKDPWFFVSGLFVQKPQRLMAILMIMGLGLLIYALAEHQVRRALQQRNATLPNQVGKGTSRPTLRRLFQVFEGIDVLVQAGAHGLDRRVLNLRPQHRQILDLMGPAVQRCYLWEPVEPEAPAPAQAEERTRSPKSYFDDG